MFHDSVCRFSTSRQIIPSILVFTKRGRVSYPWPGKHVYRRDKHRAAGTFVRGFDPEETSSKSGCRLYMCQPFLGFCIVWAVWGFFCHFGVIPSKRSEANWQMRSTAPWKVLGVMLSSSLLWNVNGKGKFILESFTATVLPFLPHQQVKAMGLPSDACTGPWWGYTASCTTHSTMSGCGRCRTLGSSEIQL